MGITPLVFTGISQFSDDFQTVVDRAVSIAAIPLTGMQNEQADLLVKKQLLTELRAGVGDLASRISDLGRMGETKAVTAMSSSSSRVSVTVNGTVNPGTHTITEITSVAKAAAETSLSGYASPDAAPVSSDGILQLVVGSNKYTVDLTAPGKNNLNGLRDAINSLGAGVSATVLNTGTGDTPYYLSIASVSTGARALALRETAEDPATNLLTAANQGANAVFKLDGLPIVKEDNVVNGVIPGVAFTIGSTTSAGETVTLTFSSSRGELAGALESLVADYNSVVDLVNAQIGKAAGLLSGDHLIREVQANLRKLTGYGGGSGSIRSLADLGIELDQTGKMSFDSDRFYSLSNADMSDAFAFLGSPTTGLGAIASDFTQLSDPVSGLIRLQQDQYDQADRRLDEQIAALTERIGLMQVNLTARLQQADVLLAQLESQQTMLNASLESLNLVLFGKREDSR